jgi:hypothetical protein
MSRAADPAVRREWERRLERWSRSGRTIGQFCEQEGVSQSAFFAWRRRLAQQDVALPKRRLQGRRAAAEKPALPDAPSRGRRKSVRKGALHGRRAAANDRLETIPTSRRATAVDAAATSPAGSRLSLVPMRVAPAAVFGQGGVVVEMVWRDSVTVRVHEGCRVDLLREVIRLLQEAEAC